MKKLLTTMSAVAMTATSIVPAVGTPVMAQEPETTEKTITESTVAEKLNEALEQAKEVEEKASESLDKATSEKNKVDAQVANAQGAYDTVHADKLAQEQAANDALIKELETNLKNIEQKQAEITEAEEQKEALLKEQEAKNKELEEAKQAVTDAETALKEAQEAAAIATPEEVTASENRVAEAQKALDEANAKYAEAQRAAQYAQSQVNMGQTMIDIATEDLKTAQTNYDNALQAVKDAETVVAEKQAIYDAALDPELKAQAEQAVVEAQAAYDTAKANADAAYQELLTAQANLTAKEQELTQLQTPVTEAEAAVTQAKAEVATATEDFNKADEAHKQAVADHADALKTLQDAQKVEEEKRGLLNTAMEKVTALEQEATNVQTEIDKLEAKISELEAGLKGDEEAYKQGSLGFFKSVNAGYAVTFLLDCTYASYTNLGAEDDCTNLENMKKSLEIIKQTNELRKQNGLAELKVSHEMMAAAQANANASAQILGHTSQFNVGENLAWGYDIDTNYDENRSPYKGWYYEEKEMYENGNHNFHDVGHYLNIIDPDYILTGAAYGTNAKRYGTVFGQVFKTSYVQNFAKSGMYTVDEYEKIFMDYYNKVVGGDSSYQEVYDKAVADLKAAQTKKDELDKQINAANIAVSEANSALASAQTDVRNAITNEDTLRKEMDATEATLEKATSTKENAEDGLEAAKTNLETVKGEIAEEEATLKAEIEELKAIKAEKETAYNELNAEATAKNEALTKAKDTVTAIEEGKESAYENLKAAKEDKAAKELTAEGLEAVRDGKQSYLDDLNEAQAIAVANKEQKDKDALKAKAATVSAEAVLNEETTILNHLKGLVATVEEKQTALTDAETVKANIDAQLETLASDIASLDESIKAAETALTALEERKAVLEDAQSIWDAVKAGGNDVLETEDEALIPVAENIENYKALREKEASALEELEAIKAIASEKDEAYQEALATYNAAKEARIKAEKAIDAYLASLEKEDAVVVETGKDGEKADGVNTATGTNLYVYVAGMVLTGAMAVAFLQRKKRAE